MKWFSEDDETRIARLSRLREDHRHFGRKDQGKHQGYTVLEKRHLKTKFHEYVALCVICVILSLRAPTRSPSTQVLDITNDLSRYCRNCIAISKVIPGNLLELGIHSRLWPRSGRKVHRSSRGTSFTSLNRDRSRYSNRRRRLSQSFTDRRKRGIIVVHKRVTEDEEEELPRRGESRERRLAISLVALAVGSRRL